MIQLTITDSNGTELQIGDVMAVYFTNPLIKFFGVLEFDKEENRFYIEGYDLETHPFNKELKYCRYERLAGHDALTSDKGTNKELLKQFGRVEVTDVKEFDKIFNLCK